MTTHVIAVPHKGTYIPKHNTRRVFSYSYGSLKQHNENTSYIPTYVTTSVATANAVCAMM